MDDFDNLVKAVKDHKETCIHKSKCVICRGEFNDDVEDQPWQCDVCGVWYLTTGLSCYHCTCFTNHIYCCYDCNLSDHVEVIYEVETRDEYDGEGVYIDKCCPMTKAAK